MITHVPSPHSIPKPIRLMKLTARLRNMADEPMPNGARMLFVYRNLMRTCKLKRGLPPFRNIEQEKGLTNAS